MGFSPNYSIVIFYTFTHKRRITKILKFYLKIFKITFNLFFS